GPGDHRRRHPDRHADRVLDHHRNRVPVARHGPLVHPIGPIRRRSDHDRLSGPGRADLRGRELHRRHPLRRDRSPAACGTRGGGAGMTAERVQARGFRGRWSRLCNSDLYYSFIRSPTTMLAAVVALVCIVGALLAPALAPYTPFDPASIDINDAFKPPAW